MRQALSRGTSGKKALPILRYLCRDFFKVVEKYLLEEFTFKNLARV